MSENLGAKAVKAAAGLISTALASGAPALDEWQAKALFAAYGIPVPAGALANTEEEALAAAARIGGKLVMKGIATHIQHKTEAGLVVLGVEGPEAVDATYRLLQQRAEGALEAVLVEQMIAGNRELMVGMKRDPVFGPVVAFGLGGVLTEALGDVVLALTPVDDRDAAELPGLIKAKKLLGSFRGYPPVDKAALAKVIQAIGQMALDNPHIVEIDVNPVLIQGDQPVAADALIILSKEPAKTPERSSFVPNLKALLAPRSLAVVGASGDIGKWGGSALKSIVDGGYAGTIYPVNPKGGEFFGLQSYPSLADLPEAPDLALLAVGGHQVAPMLEECGRKGIRAAIAIAAGFAETGESGAESQREIARIASEGGVTMMGPNCMGMVSNEVSLHAVGFVELHPPKGKLSFVSQSGNMGVMTTLACQRRGIGIDKFASVGNEAQIGAVDVLDYLRDDPNTTCVMMYIEGIDDGRRFVDVAQRTTAVKPVVVLRTGLTEYGSKAAASHTGAMAGSAAVWEAAARRAGVVACTTLQDVVDLGTSLAYLPLPKGRRIAVITQGGGAGVMAADEVARNGLTLAELPPELYTSFDEILPPFWSKQNPLDLVASAGGEVASRVLRAVVECDAVDAVIALSLLGVPTSGSGDRTVGADGEFLALSAWEDSLLALVAELMESTGKPIINVPDSPIRGSVFDYGKRYSPIVLSSPLSAARALDKMEWYAALRRDRNPLFWAEEIWRAR
jgi:acyl-CoA synthetase (NDP forming)